MAIEADAGNPALNHLAEFDEPSDEVDDLQEVPEYVFDTTNTEQELRGSGLESPAVTRELFASYVAFFVRVGILPQPEG
jgi:hypothetical protein